MDIFQVLISSYPVWTLREIIAITVILLSALILTWFLLRTQKIGGLQAIAGLLLLVYMILVLGTTLFTRMPGERQYQLELFWSWKEIIHSAGRRGAVSPRGLLIENLLNVLLLFPAGVLFPLTLKRRVKWWQGLLLGIVVSVSIEVGQLILCRGLFEFDDIVHNAIGCMVGCMLVGRWRSNKK